MKTSTELTEMANLEAYGYRQQTGHTTIEAEALKELLLDMIPLEEQSHAEILLNALFPNGSNYHCPIVVAVPKKI